MSTTPDVVAMVTDAGTTLLPILLACGAAGVTVTIGVIGLKRGVQFFKSMIKP